MKKTVQSFSQGEFRKLMQELNDVDFKKYNVICIFNTYESVIHTPKSSLKLFFNDVNNEQLSVFEKFIFNREENIYNLFVKCKKKVKPFYGLPFTENHAKQIKNFIDLDKDILVHCEYGHSRSVAVASYFQQYHYYTYLNENENNNRNTRVFDMLKDAYENDSNLDVLKAYHP